MSFALDIKAVAEIEIGKATIAPIDPEPSWNDIAATDTHVTEATKIYDEDAELLDRLANGDEAAFRALVERHIDRAYAIALRIIGNAADAEDVVQDTMLKVWTIAAAGSTAAPSFRPGSTVSSPTAASICAASRAPRMSTWSLK
jgi:RNA polymerase sigma-70 factor, ECF subfamily